jgi:hypothetical protein
MPHLLVLVLALALSSVTTPAPALGIDEVSAPDRAQIGAVLVSTYDILSNADELTITVIIAGVSPEAHFSGVGLLGEGSCMIRSPYEVLCVGETSSALQATLTITVTVDQSSCAGQLTQTIGVGDKRRAEASHTTSIPNAGAVMPHCVFLASLG